MFVFLKSHVTLYVNNQNVIDLQDGSIKTSRRYNSFDVYSSAPQVGKG